VTITQRPVHVGCFRKLFLGKPSGTARRTQNGAENHGDLLAGGCVHGVLSSCVSIAASRMATARKVVRARLYVLRSAPLGF